MENNPSPSLQYPLPQQVKENQYSGNWQVSTLLGSNNPPARITFGAQIFLPPPKHLYSIMVESDGQYEDAFPQRHILNFLKSQNWRITLISTNKAGAMKCFSQTNEYHMPGDDWRMIMIYVKLLPDTTDLEETTYHQTLSESGEFSISIKGIDGFVEWYNSFFLRTTTHPSSL